MTMDAVDVGPPEPTRLHREYAVMALQESGELVNVWVRTGVVKGMFNHDLIRVAQQMAYVAKHAQDAEAAKHPKKYRVYTVTGGYCGAVSYDTHSPYQEPPHDNPWLDPIWEGTYAEARVIVDGLKKQLSSALYIRVVEDKEQSETREPQSTG